ncbi:YbjQ family protein [Veillonella caviae]|mgnify:FL=1|uniref:YbjQ family protein n=1 Tax=Veillonella caviae TaxID=248316 RepID=UPI000F8C68F6|nr:YbjQ family protein [Veillonella caviae]MCF0157523.1 YbjQ family protein [Veillonella sp.]MCI5708291.1 YbjQ family protein [Veillonella caviae]MCI7692895.1 YbjQ family protein [Veillonella caviae]MDY5254507.1 YbjQ family protein [Veillonella caviae]MDY5714696.1 YbjQ family protein [Veillonella caviae]
MIITTTMNVEGHDVKEYKGIVFGEVVEGRNFLKDFMSGIRDVIGGRSGSYENSLMKARQAALDEMADRAQKIGANAVIGVSVQYNTLGQDGGMLMVTCTGTAVVI